MLKPLRWGVSLFTILFIASICITDKSHAVSPTDAKTALEYLDQGTELARKGKFDKAKQLFEKASSLDPGLKAETHFNLGMMYTLQKRLIDATVELRKAAELKPNDVRIRFNLANAYNSSGSKDNAIVEYRKIVQIEPNLFWAHFNLGTLLKENKDFDSAIDHYQKAVELNAKLPMLHYELGNLYDKKHMRDEAIAAYDQAIALDPKHYMAIFQRGLQIMRKGEYDNAQKAFNDVLAINPKHAESYVNLGTIEMFQKNPVDALPHFLKGLSLNQSLEPALINTAVAYRDTKQYDKALDYAQKAKEVGSKRAQLLIESIHRRISEE